MEEYIEQLTIDYEVSIETIKSILNIIITTNEVKPEFINEVLEESVSYFSSLKEEDIELAIKLTFSHITKEFEENTALYDIENGVYVDGQNKSEIDPIVRKLK